MLHDQFNVKNCFAISSLRSPANDNVFSLIRPLDSTFSANVVYARVAIQLSLFSERLHANNLSLIRRSLIITGAIHYRETIATSMFYSAIVSLYNVNNIIGKTNLQISH